MMRIGLVLAFLAATLSALLVGCDGGKPAGSAASPPVRERIVTCAPNLAEFVEAVGAFDQVVGVSRFTERPPAARELPAVTDLATPNLEGIAALKPTLLLTIPSNRDVRRFFDGRAGVRVVDVGRCESLEDIARVLRITGDAVGSPDAGLRAEQAFRAQLAAMRADAPTSSTSVLVVLGDGALGTGGVYAAGRGTYIDELLGLAGGRNILAADLGLYPVLSKEAVLRLDPDIVLVLTAKPLTDQELASARVSWEPLRTLRVIREEGRFRNVASNALLVPGPRVLEELPPLRAALAVPEG